MVVAAVPARVELDVVDVAGNPMARARARVGNATIQADAFGRIYLSMPPATVVVEAPRCAPSSVATATARVRVTLTCSLPVIGIVRVATGSNQGVHALPMAASILDREQIAAIPATTADGLLRALPGVDRNRSNSLFTNYGQLRVSFAGAGTDRGLVLVDGIPAQDGFAGQLDWAAYPALDLTRAELLRGAGSALYGPGAVGGVLALQTLAPPAQPGASTQGQLVIEGGTHEFAQTYAGTAASLSPHVNVSASLQQQRLQYDALAPGFESAIDAASQAQTSMASIRVRYAPSQSAIFEYGYRGAWDYQQEGRPNYDFWRRFAQNALSFAHPTPQANVSILQYVRNAFVTNRADVFPASPGTLLYTQYVPTNESGTLAAWNVDAGASSFAVRAESRFVNGVSDQYDRAGTLTASGSGAQTLGGFGAQETWTAARFEVVAGARADVVSVNNGASYAVGKLAHFPASHEGALSPRVAVRYDLTKELAFRISDGSGFRPPFLNELLRGYVIGPTRFLPNPNLDPERSNSFSSGVDWVRGSRHASFDIIATSVSDAIAFRTIAPNVQRRSNIERTQTNGETLTYAQELSRCTRIAASGTAQNPRVVAGSPAIAGKYLAYVPTSSATLLIDGTIGAVGVGVSGSYLGVTYADDLNTQPLGTAIVAGASIAFPLADGARVILGGDNLTGARYLSSIDRYGPPTVISLSVRAPIGPATAASLCKAVPATP